jgi:hypothetical protein
MEANSLATDNWQVIDFFEKEIAKLTLKFNKNFEGPVCDRYVRSASILAIVQAELLARSIRSATDEKQINKTTREFCHIRDVLNNFFDKNIKQQTERNGDVRTNQRVAAG